jgi:hypothetical protein
MKLHEALIIIRDEQGGKGAVERTSALFGHFEIDGDIITHVVGDYVNGNLYSMSSSVYDDDGTEIVRKRIAPHVSTGLTRAFHTKFQHDIESGTGIDGTGQGEDPQAMLRFSDDGGHTWSNDKWTGFGAIGQTKKRALWRRLGASRDRVYEITITDPVKVAIIGADLDVQPGAN